MKQSSLSSEHLWTLWTVSSFSTSNIIQETNISLIQRHNKVDWFQQKICQIPKQLFSKSFMKKKNSEPEAKQCHCRNKRIS